MVEIRRIAAGDWPEGREVRLRALADAPTAFGTTHAEALERPDEWWQKWARDGARSEGQALYLAWDGEHAVGIAGAFRDDAIWHVFSMWVDPAHRGNGTGRALLDAVVGFARDHGAAEVVLSVTDGNDAARALYERYGFVDTGHAEALRSHPELQVRDMKLAL
jgi:ribosomal protein S18 acetylase RimI-like enzyme